jgi:predicted RNase H-like nuclease (RuvC/YqgF family)
MNIELTPAEGLAPNAVDALLQEMQETTHEVERLRRHNDDLTDMVRASNRRATRIETRLVRLMEHFGLDPMGEQMEPEHQLPKGTV